MTHVVYLIMMVALGTDVPRQMATEGSMAACVAWITQRASAETGDHRNFWYCQPAVANITLGPQASQQPSQTAVPQLGNAPCEPYREWSDPAVHAACVSARAGGAFSGSARPQPPAGMENPRLMRAPDGGTFWFPCVGAAASTPACRAAAPAPAPTTQAADNDTGMLSAEPRGAIGDQMRACWTPDPKALGADQMQVLLTVTTDASGVARLVVVAGADEGRLSDPAFRAFAERARRAVLDPRCANLQLPPTMLGKPNVLTLRFTP